MIKYILVLGLLAEVLLPTAKTYSQTHDSCLAMLHSNDGYPGYTNPDSVKVDTCYLSPTVGEDYVRGGFVIHFYDDVFHLPYAPADSIVEVTWQDIDTNYGAFREAFDTLYQRYGAYVLRKTHPEDTASWSYYISEFKIMFAQYTYAKPVYEFLNNLDSLSVRWPPQTFPPNYTSQRRIDSMALKIERIQSGEVFIQISKPDLAEELSIIDLNGKLLYRFPITGEHIHISTKDIPSGTYFVTYKSFCIPVSILK